MYVCARVRAYVRLYLFVRFSTFETTIAHKRIGISSINLIHQWSGHVPLFVLIFMKIEVRFDILWDFQFIQKCLRQL